jgi:tripartite-type tricarboxylate transporter receptor subunit TctC
MPASRRSLFLAAPSLAVAGRGVASAQTTQTFPNRPIRIVVPFTPGGITDILARAMAEMLALRLGKPAVVDNRPGAGGNVGAESVARSAPDGHTLMAVGPSVMGVAKALYPRLNYDPDADFIPVGMLGAQANVLVTSPKALADPSLDGLLSFARARPGEVTYASNGVGSLTHLIAELFAADAGIRITHVPYRGSPQALSDLVGGQTQMLFDAVAAAMPLIQAGSIHAAGVAARERSPELPDVPSLVEAGFPSMDARTWFAIFAPAATPRPIIECLRSEIAAAHDSNAYRTILQARSTQPLALTGADMEAFLLREREQWASAVLRSGARVD